MRRILRKTTIVSPILGLVLLSAPVLAISAKVNNHAVAAQTTASTKLQDAQLKSCQTREKAINSIMNRIADRGQKRLNVYSTIATRVEDFYTKKGKTVSNYDSLVADVNAKKTAAQAAVDKIKADKVAFKCDGSDPKGVASSFKADLKLEISALHDYQQSIKNLIVAVKSAQATNSTSGGRA